VKTASRSSFQAFTHIKCGQRFEIIQEDFFRSFGEQAWSGDSELCHINNEQNTSEKRTEVRQNDLHSSMFEK